MTSFARIYNLQLNMYDVISDVTDRLKKSDTFPKTIVFKVAKILDPKITIQFNVRNNQEIQISAKHALQNAFAMATSDPITKILPHHQIAR